MAQLMPTLPGKYDIPGVETRKVGLLLEVSTELTARRLHAYEAA